MGKNITRRNRKTKKMGKKNRSKKMRGGGDVTPGARINFSKDVLSKVTQNIKYLEIDLGFCTALHVRFFNESNQDTGDGLFFFYNYRYDYYSKRAAQAGRIVDRSINPLNYGTVVGRVLARAAYYVTSGEEQYKGLSETAWIKSDTSNFLEKIQKKINVKFIFKEEGSVDDTRFKFYDIFKKGFNGIFFLYTDTESKIINKKEWLHGKGVHSSSIFTFVNLDEAINKAINKYLEVPIPKTTAFPLFPVKSNPIITFESFKTIFPKINYVKYETHSPTSTHSLPNVHSLPISSSTKQENTGEQIMDAIISNDINELRKQLLIADKIYNFTDEDGRTPLYLAVKERKLDAIKELIQYPWVDVNFINRHGYSLLHFAIGYGDVEVIKILIQRPDLLIDDDVFEQNYIYNNSRPEVLNEIEKILSQTEN